MKKLKRILFTMSFLPIIISIVSLFFLDDNIPMHYDVRGVVDRMGSKYEIIIYPIIILILGLIGISTIKKYENKYNVSKDNKTKMSYLNNIEIMIKLFFSIIIINFVSFIYYLLLSFGVIKKFINNLALGLIIGILLILCGLFIRKSKRNNVFGLRTKWSLSNDSAWRQSNEIGGISLVVAGILSILIFNQAKYNQFLLFIILMIFIILFNVVYSMYAYKKSIK